MTHPDDVEVTFVSANRDFVDSERVCSSCTRLAPIAVEANPEHRLRMAIGALCGTTERVIRRQAVVDTYGASWLKGDGWAALSADQTISEAKLAACR